VHGVPALNFPHLVINKPKYHDELALTAWDQARAWGAV
jgi:hypothetical protein